MSEIIFLDEIRLISRTPSACGFYFECEMYRLAKKIRKLNVFDSGCLERCPTREKKHVLANVSPKYSARYSFMRLNDWRLIFDSCLHAIP